jgi:hypothetical protein
MGSAFPTSTQASAAWLTSVTLEHLRPRIPKSFLTIFECVDIDIEHNIPRAVEALQRANRVHAHRTSCRHLRVGVSSSR